MQAVAATFPGQSVVARVTVQGVAGGAADDAIVAPATADEVATASSADPVVAGRADDHVATGGSLDGRAPPPGGDRRDPVGAARPRAGGGAGPSPRTRFRVG